MANTRDEFFKMLKAEIAATGAELANTPAAIADIMAEQTEALQAAVNQPGFDQALRGARDRVALKAGLEISNDASPLDNRFLGIIGAGLRMAAVLLI